MSHLQVVTRLQMLVHTILCLATVSESLSSSNWGDVHGAHKYLWKSPIFHLSFIPELVNFSFSFQISNHLSIYFYRSQSKSHTTLTISYHAQTRSPLNHGASREGSPEEGLRHIRRIRVRIRAFFYRHRPKPKTTRTWKRSEVLGVDTQILQREESLQASPGSRPHIQTSIAASKRSCV